MKEKKLYIAYGSNLNVQQMIWRCPDAEIYGTGTIENYELLFKGSKTGSYLTIEPKKGGRVPVAIWSVSEEDERNLDRYEGFPNFYYKRVFFLECQQIETSLINESISAFAYIMHEERKLGAPTELYMETCRVGYKDFDFDQRYLTDAYIRSTNRD